MSNIAIKNYVIQRELGQGGMAVVYLAHDNKFDTNVAVKLLNKEYVNNDNIRKRFLAEAKNMYRMSHPNIIKVTDLIDDGETVAFVMEYIKGETLKDYLERKGKLGHEEIKSLFIQMLDAVQYVHEQKLVHRDIKPSNFMITPKGKVKLMDFGIAKNTDTNSAEYTQTGTGLQMGTPMYMSPEQVKSSKEVGAASDIYSLGVVLWQMITGEKPYDIKTLSIFQIQTKIVQEPLRRTNTPWDTIIQKATEKEIVKRFSNFLDFKFELNKPRKNGIWDDGTTVFDQNDDQTILEKKESNKKNLHPKPKDHKVNTSDNLPHEKKSKKGLMIGIVIGVVLLLVILTNLNYFLGNNGSGEEENARTLKFEVEVDKWKKELLLNGEVGPPCKDDYWQEENLNYYWGIQEMDSLKSDFNSDNIQDGLFYFQAENCVGGNGTGSDFAILIYSHNNQTLTEKNITKIIEGKIKDSFFEQDIYNITDINLTYKTFTTTIGGNYVAWSDEDPHCCPRNSGSFNYNPVDFSLVINNKIENLSK